MSRCSFQGDELRTGFSLLLCIIQGPSRKQIICLFNKRNLIEDIGYHMMKIQRRKTGERKIKHIKQQRATISTLW